MPFIAKVSESPEARSAAALEFIAARLAYIEENGKKSAEALAKIAEALKKK
jgi:hypothetical protein